MKFRSTAKRLTSFLLCAGFMGVLFSGCKKSDDMFPSIEDPMNSAVASDPEQSTEDELPGSEIRYLSVSLPYDDDTIRCLSALFYCKNNGIWDSVETGLTVDTDYLMSLATNYVITNTGCGNTGSSLAQIKTWENDGSRPDLFLAQDSRAVYKAGYSVPLNDYLADNENLTGQMIYTRALAEDTDNGVVFAVPHLCSAQLIMGNYEYIPSDDGNSGEKDKLMTKNTTEEFRTYLEKINEQYPNIAGLAYGYEMIPYLGSAFNKDIPTSYMVFDEYQTDADSARTVIDASSSYVRSLYSDSLAVDKVDGADPVYSRVAALWVDSSANIVEWSKYYPGSLYLLHLPCNDVTKDGVPYVSTYSLCVAPESENSEFAADFAAFISYDTDAQLLIYRLEGEQMSGLMTITRNDSVWDLICDDSLFGIMASDIRQTMDNAVYCPASFDDRLFSNTSTYTKSFVNGTDEFDPEDCYG